MKIEDVRKALEDRDTLVISETDAAELIDEINDLGGSIVAPGSSIEVVKTPDGLFWRVI